MGNPKVLKGTVVMKVRTTISDDVKDLRALQNKGNWVVSYTGPVLESGFVTGVEIVTVSVSK